jgi:hypothetical protein
MSSMLLVSSPLAPNINLYLGNMLNPNSIVDTELDFTYDIITTLPIIIGTIKTAQTIQNTTTQVDYSSYFPSLDSSDTDSIEILFSNDNFYTPLTSPIKIKYSGNNYLVNKVMYLASNIIMLMVPVV